MNKLTKGTPLPPLAVRVLSAYHSVQILEGTEGAPDRQELVELLRELAEVPVGYCPWCGFRPSLGGSTNLCGVCVRPAMNPVSGLRASALNNLAGKAEEGGMNILARRCVTLAGLAATFGVALSLAVVTFLA